MLETRPPAAPAPAARRVRGRVSLGHVVMLVAALLAGLLNYSLLRSRDTTVDVIVAAEPLLAGQPVAASAFRTTGVRVDDALRSTLLEPDALAGLDGWVAVTAVQPGELVRASDLRAPAAPGAQRAMSIPVDPAHAAGGALAPGDRVDVIEVVEGVASYVLTDAAVLATSGGPTGSGGLGALGSFTLTVAVDDGSALALAAAMDGDALEVVRSTGASPAVRDRAAVSDRAPGADEAGTDEAEADEPGAGEPGADGAEGS